MSEVTRMYELLYEERWDEKKQKERRNEAAFFSPESPITREIPIEELFDRMTVKNNGTHFSIKKVLTNSRTFRENRLKPFFITAY